MDGFQNLLFENFIRVLQWNGIFQKDESCHFLNQDSFFNDLISYEILIFVSIWAPWTQRRPDVWTKIPRCRCIWSQIKCQLLRKNMCRNPTNNNRGSFCLLFLSNETVSSGVSNSQLKNADSEQKMHLFDNKYSQNSSEGPSCNSNGNDVELHKTEHNLAFKIF